MKKETTAILIVDPQEEFIDYFEKEQFNQMVENNLKLIQYAKKKSIPIYNFKAPGFGNTIPEIMKEIQKYKIAKTLLKSIDADSCFTNKKLEGILKKQKIEDVIITGLNGPYCPKTTAIMAKQKGYNIHSAEGLIIASEPKKMLNFESWFFREGNYYDSTQELIDEIQ